jgi:hypothetical protein
LTTCRRRSTSGSQHANLYNQRVARQLRTEATHLYTLASHASGTVSQSIRGEAQGITKVSIAIEERDADLIGSAANAANSSLADLRGTCNF